MRTRSQPSRGVSGGGSSSSKDAWLALIVLNRYFSFSRLIKITFHFPFLISRRSSLKGLTHLKCPLAPTYYTIYGFPPTGASLVSHKRNRKENTFSWASILSTLLHAHTSWHRRRIFTFMLRSLHLWSSIIQCVVYWMIVSSVSGLRISAISREIGAESLIQLRLSTWKWTRKLKKNC